MGREGRLGVLAGSVLAAAIAALPIAGTRGERADQVATVAGEPSTAEVAPDRAGVEPELPLAAHQLAPTPTAATAPTTTSPPAPQPEPEPLPPPPPPPVEPDPDQGVAAGNPPALAMAAPGAAPAAPAAATPVVASTDGRRVWAVVIGIDDYPGRRYDLRAAGADARDLAAGLVRVGVPADHVRPVYDRAATIDGVLDAIEWLVENAGPDDTAVFLYAGHVRDLGAGTEAIVTADGGWITDWFVADRFRDLRARDAWFVIAGCYGGGFDELLGPGRILTAAAGPGQLAYESDAFGRSYLAEYVFNRAILQGAVAEPTVQASVEWAMDRLAEENPDRQLWHRDEAGHAVSLDGIRRDGPSPPAPEPAAPPAPQPVAATPPENCLLGLIGIC